MVSGTSTGSLIAFGLVGGKLNENGSRTFMTVKEIIELYQRSTKNIFKEQPGKTWLSLENAIRYQADLPHYYSQAGIKEVLKKVFGDLYLTDIDKSSPKCVAAAVASEFNEDPKYPDKLEIFDTKNENQQYLMARDILLASADAPVYFETPTKVGQKSYIDGGIAGNCPLGQAIPRILQIHGKGPEILQTVISIAPPTQEIEKKKNEAIAYWMKYFPTQLTDGFKVYVESQKNYPKASFARAKPVSEKAQKFKMDETNVDAMIQAIDEERLNEPQYYNQIMDMAALTVSRLDGIPLEEDFLHMMVNIGFNMYNRRKFKTAIQICENLIYKLANAGKHTGKNIISNII